MSSILGHNVALLMEYLEWVIDRSTLNVLLISLDVALSSATEFVMLRLYWIASKLFRDFYRHVTNTYILRFHLKSLILKCVNC
jgi:hypothetical protein